VVTARAVLLAAADLRTNGLYVVLPALAAIDALDGIALDDAVSLRELPTRSDDIPKRFSNYVPRLLQHILSDLDRIAAEPPEPRKLVYKRVEDVELSLYLHAPAGEPPAAGWSAVVFFHGGGWNSGSPTQFEDHCRHLAELGIVGVTAEYRLSKKHGTTPFECVADGKSAVRWVREHAAELGIDPARIAAGGGSAGGHGAAAVATVPGLDDEPDAAISCLPDALVLYNPVSDNGPDGYGHKRLGDRYTEISPAHNLRAGVAPTLVMLGTKDSLIPVETALRYQEQMREVGGRCELRLYEGQPHGFFNRSKSEEMYRATVAEMDLFLADLGWLND
jgi:acetyl esterase